MNLARDDWSAVLRLLDEALELPALQRDGWLAAQSPELQRLQPALRQLLDERHAIETGDFLGELPPLPPSLPLDAGFSMGHRIGPYAVLRELGQGGMASVWLAERADGAHEREVALKLPHLGARARVIGERFARERKILSALTHPCIASVLDAGTDGTQPWLAMEYVDGRPITEWATQHRLAVPGRLRLFLQVLQAVQHAHSQLVIHRDIKPSNVLVDANGQVKLLDFGVAKLLGDDGATADTELTQLGGRVLTPQYASPEQVAGQPLGTASDVYSLGVLLYELLTGHLPYTLKRATPAALEEAILAASTHLPSQATNDPAARRALRGDVDTIVGKALALRPGDRYGSAEAFAQDIERHLALQPIQARPSSRRYRVAKWLRRHRVAFAWASATLVALVAGLSAALWQAHLAQDRAASLALQNRKADASLRYLSEVFATMATTQGERGREQLAQTLERAIEEAGTRFASDPAVHADLLGTTSLLYSLLDKPDQLIVLLKRRVGLLSNNAADRREKALTLRMLAAVYGGRGDAAPQRAAIEGGLQAISGDVSAPGREMRALLLAELADSYIVQGDLDRAEALLEQALGALRPDGTLTEAYGFAARAMADVKNHRGQHVQASELLLQALRAVQSVPFPETNLVATMEYELGLTQARLDRAEDAARSFEAALTKLDRQVGPQAHTSAFIRARLGELRGTQGRYREALELTEAGIAALKTVTTEEGNDNLPRAKVMRASVLLAMGRTREAQLELADLARQKMVDTVDTLNVMSLQAQALTDLGDANRARLAWQSASDLATSTYGSGSVQWRRVRIGQARWALAQCELPLARAAVDDIEAADPLQGRQLRSEIQRMQHIPAVESIQALVADFSRLPQQARLPSKEVSLRLSLGKALLERGLSPDAAAQFTAVQALIDQHADNSPVRAETLAWLARAQHALGNEVASRSSAARARGIVQTNAGASRAVLAALGVEPASSCGL